MSDALDYLLKVRPQAMGHYFAFLREAGSRLDPKTRSLISVITKVHSQTEAGFRQYLRRALKDGAEPAEVIDALLMAFPALGLHKIVWAIDQLLAMDLPEFRIDALTKAWHRVVGLTAIEPGDALRIEADGRALFVYRSDGGVRVYGAECPHQSTRIPASGLEGTRLVCPRHGWEFDLTDGRCLTGDEPLEELPSRIADGVVSAFW